MTLINRTCLCGCGRVFRVMPGNKTNWFFGSSHAEMVRHRDDKLGELARSHLAYLRNYRNVAGARAIAKARRSEIIPTETDVEEYVVIDADHN